MPARNSTEYLRPWFFFNGHLETIYPALFRRVKDLPRIERDRITMPDGDFLDLDWMRQESRKLLILQHGLEGSSDRAYVLGMARAFYQHGYDVCAWNFRGCSGEMNRIDRFYHSGASDDLEYIIDTQTAPYEDITLIGFSLGGNLTLKYLGEKPRDRKVKRAVVFSVPLDLDSGAYNLNTLRGYIYQRRFLKNLKEKIRQKAVILPESLDVSLLKKVKSVRDFDEYYTGPLHGFEGASDYYRKCSSRYFLAKIQIPTLIVNALNDPLLTPESLNHEIVGNSPNVFLETTRHGGHVGFSAFANGGMYWSERRALKFCLENS